MEKEINDHQNKEQDPFWDLGQLFSCECFRENGKCFVEKVLLIMVLILLILNSYQVFVTYPSSNRSKKWFKDRRHMILSVALVSCINSFVHYGLSSSSRRGNRFFVIEIFKYTILKLICSYYCSKASKILKNL